MKLFSIIVSELHLLVLFKVLEKGDVTYFHQVLAAFNSNGGDSWGIKCLKLNKSNHLFTKYFPHAVTNIQFYREKLKS